MRWIKDNWQFAAGILGALASALVFTWSVSQSQAELTQSVHAVVDSVSAIERKVDRISDSLASMDKRVAINSLLSDRIKRNEVAIDGIASKCADVAAMTTRVAIDVARIQGAEK